MAYRYWRPWIRGKHKAKAKAKAKWNSSSQTGRLRQLLKELTARDQNEKYDIDPKKFAYDKYYRFTKWGSRIWNKKPPKQPKFRPCLADDYQRFKRDFITEYDGEVVQETGMTHKEFWEWFTKGKREGVELHSEEYWDSIPEELWEWEV